MNLVLDNLRSTRWLVPLLLVLSVVCVWGSAKYGLLVNVLVLGVIGVVATFYVSYQMPKYIPVILMLVVFTVPFWVRVFYLYDAPYGFISEVLIVLMTVALILRGRFSGWRNAVGIMLLIWILWNIMSLANPAAESRMAGIMSVRKTLFSYTVFFIIYSSINSKRDIYLFFRWWFGLSIVVALYAFYQEYVGLPAFDMAYVNSNETIYNLLYTWGRLRKFSIFFSPTAMGILLAYAGVAGIILFFLSARSMTTKIVLLAASFICMWAMTFSGSRTSTVLIPVGIVVMGILTLKRNVLIGMALFAVLGGIMIMKPSSSKSMYVMMTAFDADDPSMNVRLTNQKIIQSYIQEKPFGFGLGSVGGLGRKYSPGAFITSFPPDSELVRIAMELGWFGLLLWCGFMAGVLIYGINIYFKARDKEWRAIVATLVCLMFMVLMAQYPQEMMSVVKLTFMAVMALLAKAGYIITNDQRVYTNDEE